MLTHLVISYDDVYLIECAIGAVAREPGSVVVN